MRTRFCASALFLAAVALPMSAYGGSVVFNQVTKDAVTSPLSGATYTQVAVKYAKLAQQLGVGMFAIGEETDRLFRTRSSPRFPNHFRNELSQMVGAVRAEYTGLLTYTQQVFVNLDHPEWC